MEGISHEACALAGAWKLDKLIALYDDNGISIDGAVKPWFIDDTPKRFEAYGWNVIAAVDGQDVDAVDAAITKARASTGKPTLICCKTTIGKGAPTRAGTAKAHGEALGVDEVKATRAALGWPYAPFVLPDEVYRDWDATAAGAAAEAAWRESFARLCQGLPRARRRVQAAHRGRAAGELARGRRRRPRSRRTPRPRPSPAARRARSSSRRSRRRCPSCSAAAPT